MPARLPPSSAQLTFAPPADHLRDALSAVVQVGDTLWLANDETASLERLTLQGQDAGGNPQYAEHTRFALHNYLHLPRQSEAADPDSEEADVEGLDYHDGYLWLVTSHSLKRKKPNKAKLKKSPETAVEQLAIVSHDPNRYLLARIPLVMDTAKLSLQTRAEFEGRTLLAAQLHGNGKGNDLTDALRTDPHLQAFLDIPGKDNGLDIEGLAVVGKRLLLGLRGPVLRGWAVILELELVDDADDPAILRLQTIGADERPYRKHFLPLDGLGVRDLCVQGDDLLILAGPTMSLDGPVTIYRWVGGAQPEQEGLVSAAQLQTVLDVPYGQGEDKGNDHAEGIALFDHAFHADGKAALLVVYDSAADHRKPSDGTVLADIHTI